MDKFSRINVKVNGISYENKTINYSSVGEYLGMVLD